MQVKHHSLWKLNSNTPSRMETSHTVMVEPVSGKTVQPVLVAEEPQQANSQLMSWNAVCFVFNTTQSQRSQGWSWVVSTTTRSAYALRRSSTGCWWMFRALKTFRRSGELRSTWSWLSTRATVWWVTRYIWSRKRWSSPLIIITLWQVILPHHSNLRDAECPLSLFWFPNFFCLA